MTGHYGGGRRETKGNDTPPLPSSLGEGLGEGSGSSSLLAILYIKIFYYICACSLEQLQTIKCKMKQLLILIFLMCSVNLSAQVTIGALEEPHAAAILDLSKVPSLKLGLLLPRANLQKLNEFSPLTGDEEEATGMLLYNEARVKGEVYPGTYVWEGDKWKRLGCMPAVVTEHNPANKIVSTTVGGAVTLGITVADSPGLTYQWYEASTANNTGGTPAGGDATNASYSPPTSANAYYYCVVASSCYASADTSDVFTVNVVNLNNMPTGSGCFGGRTTFDVAMENDGGIYGTLLERKDIIDTYANFAEESTYRQTYTFKPAGPVYNVRFVYEESASGIVKSLTPDANYSGSTSSNCTATLVYADDLNNRATGLTSGNPLKVDIYAVYNNGSKDVAVKLTAKIQDCFFTGAYTMCGSWLEFMPHNLGAIETYATPARQMAYNSPTGDGITNSVIYGGLYQWGRKEDGHQIRKHKTDQTSTASTTSEPKHSNFIIGTDATDFNWYSGNDPDPNTLWTDASRGANDPCPLGYKVPTTAQWLSIFNGLSDMKDYTLPTSTANDENQWSWYESSGTNGLYRSATLFLPAAGFRSHSTGNLYNAGSFGYYWNSTVIGTRADCLIFSKSIVKMTYNYARSQGSSVRCVAE
jgi:uncharacterized protein (TIGR02145 family)